MAQIILEEGGGLTARSLTGGDPNVAAINAMFSELYGSTGFATYIDTNHVDFASGFSLLADTDTVLPNNAGTKLETQKPTYIETYYDDVTQKILGREGDSLSIMIYFTVVPTNANQWLNVWLDITGGAGTPVNLANLYKDTKNFPKGAGEERGVLFSIPAGYTLDTWEANGGSVYIRSNFPATVYGINYNFNTPSKAR